MKIKITAALLATSAASFGGSLAIQAAEWPEAPELAALLNFTDVLLLATAWASGAIAGLVMLCGLR